MQRLQIVITNKKGLTLVEVLIALVVLLLVSLAMMQTALVSIDSNMINVLRNEAVSIAEMRMNQVRNTPFAILVAGTTPTIERRPMRNVKDPADPTQDFPFFVSTTIADINVDNKRIDITVTWEWRDKTVASANPYTHMISTIVKRP